MSKVIRAVLIDPYAHDEADRVREVELDGTLKAYYENIGHGCSLIEAVYIAALEDECLYVDEEGLWQQYAGFQLRGFPHPLMGRGLIVSTDQEGDTISTTLPVEYVRGQITGWLMDFERMAEEAQS